MTEFETVIVKPLINSGKIVFYKRYVDDTLVFAKPSGIKHILMTPPIPRLRRDPTRGERGHVPRRKFSNLERRKYHFL